MDRVTYRGGDRKEIGGRSTRYRLKLKDLILLHSILTRFLVRIFEAQKLRFRFDREIYHKKNISLH